MGTLALDADGHEVFGADDLYGDPLRRDIDIVERRAAAARDDVVYAVLQIVLVVVVVSKESRRDMVFFEHRDQRSHMGVVALAVPHGRVGRMMGHHEAKIRSLVLGEILFHPPGLLGPESLLDAWADRKSVV